MIVALPFFAEAVNSFPALTVAMTASVGSKLACARRWNMKPSLVVPLSKTLNFCDGVLISAWKIPEDPSVLFKATFPRITSPFSLVMSTFRVLWSTRSLPETWSTNEDLAPKKGNVWFGKFCNAN